MAGSITAQEFSPLSRQGGFDLIDVRSPSEFYEVHAVGALLAPLDSLDPKAIMESRGERASEPLYVICKSGGRSAQACRMFEQAGYSNVINFEGGTMAWIGAGLPVNRGTRRPISIERQIRMLAGITTAAGTVAAYFSPWFLIVPLVIGLGMAYAGYSNSCAMGRLLARMPWNRQSFSGGCGGCSTGSCSSAPVS